MNITFGEYLKMMRSERNLTLTQLAAKIDLDSANLCKIENGKREFDEKRLSKLSNALNIDLEQLKLEYYSDFIAKKLYQNDCNNEALSLAEQKIEYLKNKNLKQIKISF